MNKKICLFFLLLIAKNIQAQDEKPDSKYLDNTALKVAYYGNFIFDNGLKLGAEYLWIEKLKTKTKKSKEKTISHQLLFNGNLGFSTNFNNLTDNGLHTYYGLIYRRTSPKRWQLNVEINPLGYYRSFLPETYEVKDDKVSKIQFPGRSYYAPSFGIGIGRQGKKSKLSGWYLNLNYSLRTPYNAGSLPTYSLNFGYRLNFKNKI